MMHDPAQVLKMTEATKQLYQDIIYSSPSMIAVFKGKDMIVDLANDAIVETWGKGKDVIGKSLFTILPEIVEQGYVDILAKVYDTGETYHAYEIPINLTRNGQKGTFYYTFAYQAQHGPNGDIEGVVIIANEVTPQALIKKQIQESESHFRMIAEMMPEKISNATPDGKVFFYNKSWQNYTGATFEELVENGWAKWIHPDDLEETQNNWAKSVETGTDFKMELRMLNHFGEYRWHSCKARAIKEENGEVKLWIGFNADIDDQKQKTKDLEIAVLNRTLELQKVNDELKQKNELLNLKNKEIEESKEKLLSDYARSLIEASHDPLIVISPKGKITDVNQATINVTGIIRQKLLGTDFYDYFTEPQKAKEIYKKVFLKGFVSDYPLTIKDHKPTHVLFNGSVYKGEKGKVLGAVVVARDITEQKKNDDILQKTLKELTQAKELAELATSYAKVAQVKAEDATKSKQQFLSNMSHEIRTPMNAIIGFTKVLLKTDLTAKQKEYLTAIKVSGDALIVLINDILDLAKVDAGKMSFEIIPFKLASSINSMLHLFETKIQEKNLQLIKKYDQRIPEILMGDPVRLHQIILNLISNAVKFTSKGTITVSVLQLSENDESVSVEFSVIDTGIGIPEDKKATIFENFQQASSNTSRIFGGTGLGLAIVKQLIEPQGGSIRVESELNEGSKFSFILNFQKTNNHEMPVNDIIELDTEIKDVKVLVVEDMALNQLLMRTLLDDFGFSSDIASNGKLAIEKLAHKKYDIILMDLQMPEMNGFEATKYIREVLKSDIPIIALTADVTTVDVIKCKEVGMNDYIAKPVDERLLYSKIVGLVKKNIPEKFIIVEKIRYTDLSYLNQRTKSDPTLMMEMISLYLEQTPPLILMMKQSLKDKDWATLGSAVHKMIPSFSIVGIKPNFENIAKKIQEYAISQQLANEIDDWVLQIETACGQACEELKEELERINSSK